MGWLFLLFTLIPVVELWLLIEIGQRIGALETIVMVFVTGIVGAALAKREGLKVLREWQGAMTRGEVPSEGLTGAALVLVGGVLLVTPGVVTDVAGLLLLIPVTRRFIAARIRGRLERGIAGGRVHLQHGWPVPGAPGGGEREVRGEAKVLSRDEGKGEEAD